MLLDLREIIGVPGGKVSFEYEPDLTGAAYGSVTQVIAPSRAAGSVKNNAGVLAFSANVDAVLTCVCARCLTEFDNPVHRQISVPISEGGENGDNPDSYLLVGDKLDIGEIIVTEFVLEIDQRFLCKEDCKGICEKCGADLNNGPCSCKAEIDPRLAVLGQFLDDE